MPLTKSGRQRKIGKAMTGGGCIVSLMQMLATIILAVVAILLAV